MFGISRVAAISLAVLLLASCGTVKLGQDFDMKVFETKIERGTSTQDQIRAWLGEPTNIGASMDANGERFEEWAYYYAAGKLPDMAGAKMKILQVTFDKQGVVRSYYWSASK